ncbi:MAG TPA: Type 1 glutamine amidotransferase-like domain-containing protein [Patescibacteria group bacterium]|jgi:dipeptidase E|nr:Type 1 glutamine amidotransferase-like domain-containing protein [Patescibacteria group bacterium]
MKLYLSSYNLGDNPEKLLELATDKKVAVIANASDLKTVDERIQKVKEEFDQLIEIGLQPEELDLRQYFGKQNQLEKKLNEFKTVWVKGGNTFVLRRAMAQSGFDKLIKEKVNDSDFVYAGYSAGSCVVTPTLRGLEIVDDPITVPSGYKSEIIWEGLGFVDYFIAPHYKSNHPESAMVDETVKYFVEHKMPHKTLRDGEVIIKTI